MRVNNINARASFARVIAISDERTGKISKYDDEKMNSLSELQNVLNGHRSSIYSNNAAQKIRNFFKDILGDYNGKNGITIRSFGDDVILFSGEEANKLKQLEHQANYAKDQVQCLCNMKRKRKDGIIKNLKRKLTANALDMHENGKNDKPQSFIKLNFEDKFVKNGQKLPLQRINNISYSSEYNNGALFCADKADKKSRSRFCTTEYT